MRTDKVGESIYNRPSPLSLFWNISISVYLTRLLICSIRLYDLDDFFLYIYSDVAIYDFVILIDELSTTHDAHPASRISLKCLRL